MTKDIVDVIPNGGLRLTLDEPLPSDPAERKEKIHDEVILAFMRIFTQGKLDTYWTFRVNGEDL